MHPGPPMPRVLFFCEMPKVLLCHAGIYVFDPRLSAQYSIIAFAGPPHFVGGKKHEGYTRWPMAP